MRCIFAFVAMVVVPSTGVCDDSFIYTPTNAYEILSLLEDGRVLVSEGNRRLVCKLADRVEYMEVELCKQILTKHEVGKILAAAEEKAILQRFVNTSDSSREAALLSLFVDTRCDAHLGIDSASAVITYVPAETAQAAEVDPFLDQAAPPLQQSSVVPADLFARSKMVDLYAAALGFSSEDQKAIDSRLYHSFEWTLNGLVERNVLAQLRPGHFKIQEDCA